MKRNSPQDPEVHDNHHYSGQRAPQQMPAVEGISGGQRSFLPPEIMAIVVPSLKVGASAGACGLFAGAAAGILQGAPPVFFSVIAGGQWFALGTSYYASRLVAFNAMGGEEKLSPGDKTKASALAGGFAGTLGGLLRGPRNIVPGAIFMSALGAGGQAYANRRAAKAEVESSTDKKGFWAKWSPITQLSDEDYEKLLEERLLRVEADIAIMDDHIKQLRESESAATEGKQSESGNGKPGQV
ncbi:hypothetical protein QBC38DRAFT_370308 [Podospora fimiseda]|uniref:Uncharacterized protein n=1 Tax=Podospora fimiseda TaxID=252190 RepID=A0AAN7BK76_9PEZI|nr:hypothetical protein QBC38DRAFT_370308 [Podospora fimiseda]